MGFKRGKKVLRTLAYTGIIGGCAIFALLFFSISQYEKAKYDASVRVRDSSKTHINSGYYTSTEKLIKKIQGGEDVTNCLEPLNLKASDFIQYDIREESKTRDSDLSSALLKIHAPIYAKSGEENYQARYDMAYPIFGDSLSKLLAKENSGTNFWILTYKDFVDIVNSNTAAYVGTAIPAYTFSMATLVAFGLVLKHAEKTKEKEEKEV